LPLNIFYIQAAGPKGHPSLSLSNFATRGRIQPLLASFHKAHANPDWLRVEKTIPNNLSILK